MNRKPSRRLIFFISGLLVFVFSVSVSMFIKSGVVKAAAACTKSYASPKGTAYDSGGFRYQVFEFKITSQSPNSVMPDTLGYINSANCGSNTVTTGTMVDLIINGNSVKPVDARIGFPAVMNPNVNGYTRAGIVPQINQSPFRPPILRISEYRYAMFSDDSAWVTVNGTKIACVNAPNSCASLAPPATNSSGLGYEFVADNCDAGLMSREASVYSPNTVVSCSSVDSWVAGRQTGLAQPGRITCNSACDGATIPLNDFTLGMAAYNTKPGASSVEILFTFKYPIPVPPTPPTCALTANPTNITAGQPVTLTWSTNGGPTSAILSPGGAVNPAGGSTTVYPSSNTTYTLTVSNGSGSNSCTRAVTVTPPGTPPTCALTANPTNITAGQPVTLTWSTNGGPTSAILSPGGAVNPAGGSTTVYPSSNTTYTLTVSNGSGSNLCTATVTVDSSGVPGGSRRLGPWDSITNQPPIL